MERNYKNIECCAKNEKPLYVPMYEHLISDKIMEKLTGVRFSGAKGKNWREYFKNYCAFYRDFGYDAVSFEGCVTAVLPGGGALGEHREPVIKTREDFERYPFDKIVKLYRDKFFEVFDALRAEMTPQMKAIGGVGNGVFEIVQDLVGYEGLCLLSYDDPELYAALFQRVGRMLYEIWEAVLKNYGDVFCVCRFGDDLGYRTNTLLPPDDIRKHIIPQYCKIISLIKERKKPFLLHSCGCIFEIMENLIAAGIDSKHSNEDAIAPFAKWVSEYGDRIGNFGGIDTDLLVRGEEDQIRCTVRNVFELAERKQGGIAIGSGNSVPDYVDPVKYMVMLDEIKRLRGE